MNAAVEVLDSKLATGLAALCQRLLADPGTDATKSMNHLDFMLNDLLRLALSLSFVSERIPGKLTDTLLALVRMLELDAVGPLAAAGRDRLVSAYNYRGCCLAEGGRFAPALEHFTAALVIDADFVPAYCNRARVLIELDRDDDALRDCRAIKAIDPQYATGRVTVEAIEKIVELRHQVLSPAEGPRLRLLRILREYDRPLRPGEARTQLRL